MVLRDDHTTNTSHTSGRRAHRHLSCPWFTGRLLPTASGPTPNHISGLTGTSIFSFSTFPPTHGRGSQQPYCTSAGRTRYEALAAAHHLSTALAAKSTVRYKSQPPAQTPRKAVSSRQTFPGTGRRPRQHGMWVTYYHSRLLLLPPILHNQSSTRGSHVG